MFLIWSWGFPSKKVFPNAKMVKLDLECFLTKVRRMKFAVFLGIFWMCGQFNGDCDRCDSAAK